MKIRVIIACVVFCFNMSAGVVAGDVMTIGTKKHQGSFEGFRDGMFLFRSDKGEMLKEIRRKVQRLELGEPCKVFLTTTGKSGSGPALLKQYKALKFIFQDGKKDKRVFASKIQSIAVDRPEPEGGRRGAGRRGSAVMPPIDISDLEKLENLSEKQLSALNGYKKARARYDEFLRASSALVAEMDKKRGAAREKLLKKLQFRKNDEQPIKNSLNAAIAEMKVQFPPE
ncbi:MAG: hypothetical protein KAH23_07410 [Kiritimatiellae bacterium]|nr:hypothetical protein [Kiritimatiellia bacterium]